MRASKLSLIGATVVLACVDAVLATRLVLEGRLATHAVQTRTSLEQQVIQLQNSFGTLAQAGSDPSPGDHSGFAGSKGPAPTGATPKQADTPAARRLAWVRAELKKLTDPELREAMLSEQKSDLRRSHIGLAHELHLSADAADALFDCLANQELRHEAHALRDLISGGDGWRDRTVLDEEAREQLAEVLGASRLGEFFDYFERLPERRRLSGLQTRLGAADALQPDQAAQLTEVLRDERNRLAVAMAGLGAGVRFQTGYPEDARRFSSDRTSQLRFDEEQLARLNQHYERIRERASLFMTPQQLRRLKEQQQSKVVSMERLLMQRRRVDFEVAELRRQGEQQ